MHNHKRKENYFNEFELYKRESKKFLFSEKETIYKNKLFKEKIINANDTNSMK